MTIEFKMPEPTVVLHQSPVFGCQFQYLRHQKDAVNNLYTADDMRAVIEQCAQIAQDDFDPYIEIRKLLEQVK